jgi:hypothetical protein
MSQPRHSSPLKKPGRTILCRYPASILNADLDTCLELPASINLEGHFSNPGVESILRVAIEPDDHLHMQQTVVFLLAHHFKIALEPVARGCRDGGVQLKDKLAPM